ncbi:hypothetical protein [Microbacterium sp. B35-04]|uniref:hypothetical protein n=1 Tax=Microbacterium sp. B35-04 TaxID=1961716 RepID=UPI0013D629A8|nr:hypothetical protein [Microbacterium sp. B35-04]
MWLQVDVGASLQPLSMLAVCLVPSILYHWRGKVRAGDWLMVGFAFAATVAWLLFDAPQFAWMAVLTQWGAAYLVGRSLGPAAGADWVTKAMAIAGTVVGAWAVLELMFGLHIFEYFAVAMDTAGWHNIQIRGAYARSEGAFGHSIAMGGFLALCVPFVIASRVSAFTRVAMLAIVLGGAFATFSRGAIIGAVAAVAISLIFLPNVDIARRTRATLVTLSIIATVAVVPLALNVLDSVSSDFTVSTSYREDLAVSFVPDLHAFGLGDGVQFLNDRQFYRQFTSIDNAYALMGLQLGWVPLAFLLVGVVSVGIRLLRRRGGPADAALAAQAIVLFTVALITQYGFAVFLVAGFAVGFGRTTTAKPDPAAPLPLALPREAVRPR